MKYRIIASEHGETFYASWQKGKGTHWGTDPELAIVYRADSNRDYKLMFWQRKAIEAGIRAETVTVTEE